MRRLARRAAAIALASALAAGGILAAEAPAQAAKAAGSALDVYVVDSSNTEVTPGVLNPWSATQSGDPLAQRYVVRVRDDSGTLRTLYSDWGMPAGADLAGAAIFPAADGLPKVKADGSDGYVNGGLVGTDVKAIGPIWPESDFGDVAPFDGAMPTNDWYTPDLSTNGTMKDFVDNGTLTPGITYRMAYMSMRSSDYGFIPDPATVVDGEGTPWAAWFDFTVSQDGWTYLSAVAPTLQVAAPEASFSADRTQASVTVTVQDPVTNATLTDAEGTVALYDQGNVTAAGRLGEAAVSGGVASIPVSGLTAGGSKGITAVYTPDASVSSSYTSSTQDYTIVVPAAPAASTSTGLSVAGSPTAGETQTLTATVTPAGAAGSVQFFDGSSRLGSAVTVASGSASVSVKLAAGSHALKAVFTPAKAAEYVGSESEVKTVTVAQAPAAQPATTATGLSVSGTKTAGKSQTVTATVSPAAAGTVTFRDGAKALKTVTVSNGSAAVSVTLTAGTHALTASFTPADASAFAASSASGSVSIAKAKASVSVAAAKSVKKGKTLKVTVTVKASGLTPTGKVTVAVAGKKATGTLKKGKVTVSVKKIAKTGKQKITVSYAGSTQIAKASSAKATVSVKK